MIRDARKHHGDSGHAGDHVERPAGASHRAVARFAERARPVIEAEADTWSRRRRRLSEGRGRPTGHEVSVELVVATFDAMWQASGRRPKRAELAKRLVIGERTLREILADGNVDLSNRAKPA
jgi:hypothetical protein